MKPNEVHQCGFTFFINFAPPLRIIVTSKVRYSTGRPLYVDLSVSDRVNKPRPWFDISPFTVMSRSLSELNGLQPTLFKNDKIIFPTCGLKSSCPYYTSANSEHCLARLTSASMFLVTMLTGFSDFTLSIALSWTLIVPHTGIAVRCSFPCEYADVLIVSCSGQNFIWTLMVAVSWRFFIVIVVHCTPRRLWL